MVDRAGTRIARVAVAALAVVAVAAGGARAEGGPATYTVEIAAEGGPAWQAEALAAALRNDLADDQLRLAPAGATAQLAIRGVLRGGTLAYSVERGRAEAAPVRGAIELRGLDRRALAGALRD